MQVFVTIKESDQQIYDKIARSIRDDLNILFANCLRDIKYTVNHKLFRALTISPEYVSISNGDLKVELGLVDGNSRLINIINIWLSNIDVTFNKFRLVAGNYSGGIRIHGINNDYTDVLSLPDSSLITERGEVLPWLDWLLNYGSKIIIADYDVIFRPGMGRTDGGIMMHRGEWGIPSVYSGVKDNNFITRAISSIQNDLEQEIEAIIRSKL